MNSIKLYAVLALIASVFVMAGFAEMAAYFDSAFVLIAGALMCASLLVPFLVKFDSVCEVYPSESEVDSFIKSLGESN